MGLGSATSKIALMKIIFIAVFNSKALLQYYCEFYQFEQVKFAFGLPFAFKVLRIDSKIIISLREI
jgi:hypothetical protein